MKKQASSTLKNAGVKNCPSKKRAGKTNRTFFVH
jgi:hypothetical protein